MNHEGIIVDRLSSDGVSARKTKSGDRRKSRLTRYDNESCGTPKGQQSIFSSHKSKDNSFSEYPAGNDALMQVLRIPAFMVRRDMMVVCCNRAAQVLFKDGSILTCSKGLLGAAGKQGNLDLRMFVTQAFDERESFGKFWSFTLETLETGRYCQCFAVFIKDDRSGGIEDSETVLVFVADPNQEMGIPFALLNSLFGLTQCEARIAIALLNGASVEQFSEVANISVNTARTHLKAVFQKTFTCSQPNLVSLLSKLVPPIDISEQD